MNQDTIRTQTQFEPGHDHGRLITGSDAFFYPVDHVHPVKLETARGQAQFGDLSDRMNRMHMMRCSSFVLWVNDVRSNKDGTLAGVWLRGLSRIGLAGQFSDSYTPPPLGFALGASSVGLSPREVREIGGFWNGTWLDASSFCKQREKHDVPL